MLQSRVRVRSWLPLILAGFLLSLQIFSPTRVTQFAFWILAGLIAVCYYWCKRVSKAIYVRRERRHTWAQVGDILEERFIVQNHSWMSVPWAEVQDYSTLPGYDASRAFGLQGRRYSNWQKTVLCSQRGVFRLGPVDILMGDPFGLFEVTVTHSATDVFVVYPAVAPLPRLLTPQGTNSSGGRANQRSLQLTTNASSVRDYNPGDPLSKIHWRTTAKRSTEDNGGIFVREFDIEPTGDVWIVLDMHRRVHAGSGLISTEEYAVILATTLASQLLSDQHAVGLLSCDTELHIVQPQKGMQHLWIILKELASLHAVSTEPLNQLLRDSQQLVKRGMTAAVITPSADSAWLEEVLEYRHRGIYPHVFLLDAPQFGAPPSPDIRSALAEFGISTTTIGRSLALEDIARRQRPETTASRQRRMDWRLTGRPDSDWVTVGREIL